MSRNMSVDIMKVLKDYVGDVDEIVEESAKEAAEICSNQLRNTSPNGPGRKGHYKNGWAVKPVRSGRLVSFVVYNKTKPQLTHLLENGHVIRNKKGTYGRTHPVKHMYVG